MAVLTEQHEGVGKPRRPMPSTQELTDAYAAVASKADLARLYDVSPRTIDRWFERLGVEARPADGSSVAPERRRGGGDGAQHVSPEQARRMRELRRDEPELSLREIIERTGATCSRQMVSLILRGKRVLSPESFPD